MPSNGWDVQEARVIEALDRIAHAMIESAVRPTAEGVVEAFLATGNGPTLLRRAERSMARRTLLKAAKDSLRRRAYPVGADEEQLSLIPEGARPTAPVVGVKVPGGRTYVRWSDVTLEEARVVLLERIAAERRAIAARERVQRFVAWRERRARRAA